MTIKSTSTQAYYTSPEKREVRSHIDPSTLDSILLMACLRYTLTKTFHFLQPRPSGSHPHARPALPTGFHLFVMGRPESQKSVVHRHLFIHVFGQTPYALPCPSSQPTSTKFLILLLTLPGFHNNHSEKYIPLTA